MDEQMWEHPAVDAKLTASGDDGDGLLESHESWIFTAAYTDNKHRVVMTTANSAWGAPSVAIPRTNCGPTP